MAVGEGDLDGAGGEVAVPGVEPDAGESGGHLEVAEAGGGGGLLGGGEDERAETAAGEGGMDEDARILAASVVCSRSVDSRAVAPSEPKRVRRKLQPPQAMGWFASGDSARK